MSALTYISFAVGVLLLFSVPGWLWLRRARVDPLISLYAGPAAGALVGGAIVAVGVVLPWSVRTTCIAGAVAMVASAVYCGLTAARPLAPARADLVGMAVFVVAFISMASFAAVPSRPYGIWGGDTVGPGRVDTPRWPGQPNDNTLPFRTGQVALYKQGGAQIRDQYAVGWWLSDRTPLTGLDFGLAAAALGVHVSSVNLERLPTAAVPMVVQDNGGFWAYQIVAMFLNLAMILGVYLLARVWLGGRVAAVAALVAALMPGLFLNGIYTWPKQAVAYFVMVAAACALRRRPALAGAFAALGYLTHPAGLIWIPCIALVLLLDAQLRARLWGTLLRFLVPLAALVAPWELFTSQVMHATSRWTTAPLGYLMTDPTALSSQLPLAWHTFLSNGIMFAIWTRIQSTLGSVVPTYLDVTPSIASHGGFHPEITYFWMSAHGNSIWGMAGVFLFPFAAVHAARAWPRFRRLVLWFVVPAVILAEVANGFAYPFANQSMFALVGVIAVIAASGLLEARRSTRLVMVACIAFELLTVVYGGLYRPFNVPAPTAVVLTLIAVVGQLILFAALAAALDLIPLRYSSSAIRGASRLKVQ